MDLARTMWELLCHLLLPGAYHRGHTTDEVVGLLDRNVCVGKNRVTVQPSCISSNRTYLRSP